VKNINLIGYSGHAFVVCDIFLSNGIKPNGYFEKEQKTNNPYDLPYLGSEQDKASDQVLQNCNYFVAIGENVLRKQITQQIISKVKIEPINAIHTNTSLSSTALLGNGVMVSGNCIINACANIGDGVICNTQSVIEHECQIGAFSHIAPGAVLCGNVKIGVCTFIGANAVIKQGVVIGDNVTIGAGAVILKNVPSNSTVVGNPQKNIH